MKARAETIMTIDLGYEQMLVFDGGPETRVRVLYGATWLTVEGEPGDAIVQPGAEVALHGGRALIEGLAPTRVQIIERTGRGTGRRAAQRLRQAWRSFRRQVERLQFGAATAAPNA